jgi:zinc transporter
MYMNDSISNNQGLVAAYRLDGKGGGSRITTTELDELHSDEGFVWLHLDYASEHAQTWLREHSDLEELVSEVLLTEETRPRSITMNDGLLVTLRGVNMNPGADPEDMVSIRIWINRHRVITTRHRRMLIIDDLKQAIEHGHGPCSPGEFLVYTADLLARRMADVVDELDDAVDMLEEEVLTAQSYQLRGRIADVRRQAIALRRYLAPQREAMTRLCNEPVVWLSDDDRIRLREVADRMMRYVEDLDSARDRASVTQEELLGRLSEQMDRRMYVLSIVAAIFLPLGFLTGLLGINVGGIPGAENKHAFFEFSVILIFVVAVQVIIFKWRKWM